MAKLTIKCNQCGNEFKSYPSSARKFCSLSCSTKFKNLNNNPHPNAGLGMIKSNCKQCGKSYERQRSNNGGGLFCSKSCRMTFSNLNNNPTKNAETKTKISISRTLIRSETICLNCGKILKATENEIKKGYKKYCSVSCSTKKKNFKHGYFEKFPSRVKQISIHRAIAKTHLEEICRLCGSTDKLHVHHRDGKRKNNEVSNLVWLCPLCHKTKAHESIKDENGKIIESKLNFVPKGIKKIGANEEE